MRKSLRGALLMSTFFRNIPTLNEILDVPPLKQLIETANRQTVVVSAKKFLSGLEAEVRSTAATVPIPNVRDLAKQIAQLDFRRPASSTRSR